MSIGAHLQLLLLADDVLAPLLGLGELLGVLLLVLGRARREAGGA